MAVLGWSRARRGALRPDPDASGLLVLSGEVAPGDAAALARQVRDLVGDGPPTEVICDVAGLTSTGLDAVDVLAHLQLSARRMGSRLRLRGVAPELRDLLALTGLGVLLLEP